jgi:acyl-CoA thioesterase-1
MTEHSIWKPVFIFASLLAGLLASAIYGKAAAQPAANEIVIVALGDSLTAGYNLAPDEAFPAQLEKALRAKGHNVRLANAGVSGDTAGDGLARLDWAVPAEADAILVELGANDALRGIPVAQTRKSLEAILSRLKERGLPALLAGMEAPRNWGQAYADEFRAMYAELARQYDAVFYPFFLDGVALDRGLSLPDGLHPNGRGVARVVERILPKVEELIQRVAAKPAKPS